MEEQKQAKGADEVFCQSCGALVKREALICVKCGVPVKKAYAAKSKTTAVFLAIFLGIWAWLYTYKKDAWKFWLNFVLGIVTFLFWFPVAWLWVVIDAAAKPAEFYTNYPN